MLRFSSPRILISLAAGVVVLGSLVLASGASGTHVRPKAATPLYTSFVVAYQQCNATNANHGPAFAFGSCAPPTPTSRWLTVGTADSNGKPANFVGSSRLVVTAAPADIKATIALSDVRCTPALAGANPPLCPSGSLNEYVGKVAVVYDLRISDHCNLPNIAVPTACPVPPGQGNPIAATVRDFRFPIVVPCVPPAPGVGSDCNLATSFNAVTGGPPFGINGTTRMNIATHDPRVMDGGPDGDPGPGSDNDDRFLEEGVFVP
jgi:hypothetical protein